MKSCLGLKENLRQTNNDYSNEKNRGVGSFFHLFTSVFFGILGEVLFEAKPNRVKERKDESFLVKKYI